MGGVGWVEEVEAVRTSYWTCGGWVGGWVRRKMGVVGGWVGGFSPGGP